MYKTINVWGRDLQLRVIFDVYDGEEVTDIQKAALDAFLKSAYNLFKSSDNVKDYCIKHNSNEIGNSIDNIFKYVMPKSIYVGRSSSSHIVSLLCDYRFDEDHGIAIIFENEKFNRIGTQDDIL